eukprot:scaffold55127_cov29-Prasinocladus_malaysianus.AAC.2
MQMQCLLSLNEAAWSNGMFAWTNLMIGRPYYICATPAISCHSNRAAAQKVNCAVWETACIDSNTLSSVNKSPDAFSANTYGRLHHALTLRNTWSRGCFTIW